MNRRENIGRHENSKPFHSKKLTAFDFDFKPDLTCSPKPSECFGSGALEEPGTYKHRYTTGSKKSQEIIIPEKQTTLLRASSTYKDKKVLNNSTIEALIKENKDLKYKMQILENERDLIKSWKTSYLKSDSNVYQEKLKFLVKNIQNFLSSSMKFQFMLREKLGQTIANKYEEERNTLKTHVALTAKDLEIPLDKYSPISSPLKNFHSEEFSSCDSETTKLLEELRVERSKTKKLQIELNNEQHKKENEMKAIRDKIQELETTENSKTELEKQFNSHSQEWNKEKKELNKELERYKADSQNFKDKIQELSATCTKIQQENLLCNSKCQELTQENFKMSESLQTYDRLYSYTKKWVEKSINEFKKIIENKFVSLNEELDAKTDNIQNIESQVKLLVSHDDEKQKIQMTLDNLNEEYTNKINLLNQKIEDSSKTYNKMLLKNNELDKEIKIKDNQIESLQIKISDARVNLETLLDEKDKNLEQINTLSHNLNELNQILIDKQQEIEELNDINSDLSVKLRKKSKELENINQRFQEISQILAEKEQKYLKINLEKEELLKRTEEKDLHEAILVFKDELNKIQTENLELASKLKSKDYEQESILKACEKAKEDSKVFELELKSLQKQNSALLDLINQKELTIFSFQELLKEQEDQLKNKTDVQPDVSEYIDQNVSFNNKISALENQIQDYKQQIIDNNDLITQIHSKDLEIEELKDLGIINYELAEDIKNKENEISDLNHKLSDQINTNQTQAKLIEEEKQKNHKLSINLVEKDDEIIQLNNKISSLLEQINILAVHKSEDIISLNAQISDLAESNNSYKALVNDLEYKINELISQNNQANDKIILLETQCNLMSQSLEKFKNTQISLEQDFLNNKEILSKQTQEINNLSLSLKESKQRTAAIISEYDESSISDKEEISRLNNQLVKQIQISENFRKELSAQNLLKFSPQCENCKSQLVTIESQKEKISQLECLIHSAEESLGGFYCNSLVESIATLVASKTQGVRRAPRPPIQRLQNEALKKVLNFDPDPSSKSPISEGSKRSNSSALSLPEYIDLRNELNEEKTESERYLTQIKLLKEDIRDLERKLKRSQDVNEKINSEVLANTLIKMVKTLPVQTTEIEGMISLIFSIVSIPKEELLKIESERKSKVTKKFGIFG
jgi:hypothetical protein